MPNELEAGGDWAAEGQQGVRLRVRRHDDGSVIFCTYHPQDTAGQMYALHLSPEAVLNLLDYLVNKPEVTN